jgi:hypothetical protein
MIKKLEISTKKPKLRQVIVLNEIVIAGVEYYLLKGKSKIEIQFPKNLVEANNLLLENNKLSITDSLYNRWLEITTKELFQKYDNLLYTHFKQLFDIREKIITSKNLYYAIPGWLYSGGVFIGSFSYSLGSLFQNWESTDELKYNGHLIIKIGGSALSGMNVYTAWDPMNNELVTGSVNGDGINWLQYVKVFRKLSGEKTAGKELNFLQLKELIKTVNINL